MDLYLLLCLDCPYETCLRKVLSFFLALNFILTEVYPSTDNELLPFILFAFELPQCFGNEHFPAIEFFFIHSSISESQGINNFRQKIFIFEFITSFSLGKGKIGMY